MSIILMMAIIHEDKIYKTKERVLFCKLYTRIFRFFSCLLDTYIKLYYADN